VSGLREKVEQFEQVIGAVVCVTGEEDLRPWSVLSQSQNHRRLSLDSDLCH